MRKTRPMAERFWRHVVRGEACWLWVAAKFKNGYGAFGTGGTSVDYAHRVSWVIAGNEIPEGMDVCHACDVRNCVNPGHLFIGTRSDNMLDCHRKRRHPGTKLTDEDVHRIRNKRDGETYADMAREIGVSRSAISAVKTGKTFGYVV